MPAARAVGIVVAFALAAAPACAATSGSGQLARAAGDALLARHVNADGGWAWHTALSDHLQTDRDVGAAGTAMGLLSVYAQTHQRRLVRAAERAGDWLLRVGDGTYASGLAWPDWQDAGSRDGTHFTSFDDGAPGVADLLWRLWQSSRRVSYRTAALAAMRWEERQAKPVGGPCPAVACRWPYEQSAHHDFRTGMGEGLAGIVAAFDTFALRTHDQRYERYALAGARYLESLISKRGAISERVGTTEYDTGFLSGSAGDAFAFLQLYRDTRERRWLIDARRLLRWVEHQAKPQLHGLAWPIELDPSPEGGSDPTLASGIEEGAAGIGWVELQDFRLSGSRHALHVAERAGNWLLATGLHEHGGVAWPEDAGSPLISTSLDAGAPGIGWFLDDLGRASGRRRYTAAATGALTWLRAVAATGRGGPLWWVHRRNGEWQLPDDASWHWGTAGIAAFAARMAGGRVDMPGEESAL